ncbi:MAG: hypothetical protein JSS81_00160 [Acidobacteria bacterium]|nr:hypothetical protein [Acidobacteriota bacterium]
MNNHQIIDRQNQNLPVAAFDYPADWQAADRVVWDMRQTAQPVTISAAAFNPHGPECFEFLPAEAFYWLEPNPGFEPIGQNKFGMINMPPMSAADAMIRLVIHKYRGGRAGFRIVGAAPIPDGARFFNAPEILQTPHEAVVVRVEYEENGRRLTEEFCGLKVEQRAGGGMCVQVNWGFSRLVCYRTASDDFESNRGLFLRIMGSLRTNPNWTNLYRQTVQQLNSRFQWGAQERFAELRRQEQFQHQLTDYYQHRRDQQNANIAAGIEHQNRVNEARWDRGGAGSEGYDPLLGRTAYHDPNSAYGNNYYDYGHHQYVWTDGQGGFYGTDDPNEDPNLGSDRNWTPARKA